MDAATLLYQQGLAFHRKGLINEAWNAYLKTVHLNPNHAPALHVLGVLNAQSEKPAMGLAWFEKALAIDPNNSIYLTNYARTLNKLLRYADALKASELALSTQPHHISALRNCAAAHIGLNQYRQALHYLELALEIEPIQEDLLLLRANVLYEIKSYTEAVTSCDKAIQLNPDSADAYFIKGNIFTTMERFHEALKNYGQALVLKPDHAMALFNKGAAFEYSRQYLQAIECYTQALQIDSQIPYGHGSLLHAKMLSCDWSGLEELHKTIKQQISLGQKAAMPFGYQAISEDESSLQQCAEIFSNDKYPKSPTPYIHPAWPSHSKIKLGYLCGEFREQATSILMTEIWEHHDKSLFETYAFDNGWDDKSPRRKRIIEAFDHVIEVTHLSDEKVSQLIFENQIDILINLNGFFGRNRNKVFSNKPSPLQVNYLGFPGTMGIDYMDILIADKYVIPESSLCYYTEQVDFLPDCYQPSDTQRVISTGSPTRSAIGLPENGFVFCCFNHCYKITPTTFEVWMHILLRVKGSVLWLLEDTLDSKNNLLAEASKLGVGPERLVFASRVPNDEHLARHTLADLFLDTWPYNAHTTANDALWMGLPVLTLKGSTFAGRVASSLLHNLDLKDLITDSKQAYEDLAVQLANDTHYLRTLRQKLSAAKSSATSFNPSLFTQQLEKLLLNAAARNLEKLSITR